MRWFSYFILAIVLASCTTSNKGVPPWISHNYAQTPGTGSTGGEPEGTPTDPGTGGGNQLTPASIAILNGTEVDLGKFDPEMGIEEILILKNTGQSVAQNLTVALAPPVSFAGGNFPGTGGTCSVMLAGLAECRVVLKIAPAMPGPVEQSIDILYNDGAAVKELQFMIRGLAAYNPGTLDKSFGMQGSVKASVVDGHTVLNSLSVSKSGALLAVGSSRPTATTGNRQLFVSRLSSVGAADTAFGTAGTFVLPAAADYMNNSLALSDDTVFGMTTRASGTAGRIPTIFKLSAVGALDVSFSADGLVPSNFGGTVDDGNVVLLDANKNFIMVGRSNALNGRVGIKRVLANGNVDATFKPATNVKLAALGDRSSASDAVMQADGKILVAGIATSVNRSSGMLLRYLPTGALDTTFDTDGIVVFNISAGSDSIHQIALQKDNKILALVASAATNDASLSLVRFMPDGALDPAFDQDGKVGTPLSARINPNTGIVEGKGAVAMQADGKILVGGYVLMNDQRVFGVARYVADGSLDKSFGKDGVVSLSLGGAGEQEISSLNVLADGRILIGGAYTENGKSALAILRIWP